MKEFLLLFRGGNYPVPSQEEAQQHRQKWFNWINSLRNQELFIATQPLEYDGKIVRGNKKLITDGPFAEGKEIIGGYLICRADSYEQAVDISKGCPILEFENGIVEIRQIRPLP
jgi:hypothetical protein